MRILSLSDIVVDLVYSPRIRQRFGGVDLVLGCGDLPYYYLEYVVSALDKPVYFVRGNHAKVVEYSDGEPRTSPHGACDLHRQAVNHHGLLLAGVEGCIRYRPGPFMYTQGEMWMNVFRLVPSLLANRLLYGRFLDIFVTHASPWGIHDQDDLPHQGVKAFRWFIQAFRPAYNFHGHIHIYRPDTIMETQVGPTRVINTFGYRETEVQGGGEEGAKKSGDRSPA